MLQRVYGVEQGSTIHSGCNPGCKQVGPSSLGVRVERWAARRWEAVEGKLADRA